MELMLLPAVQNNSWLGRLDPRVKIVSLTGFVAIMSSAHSAAALLSGILFLLLVGTLAGISPFLFLKRLLWILPFGGAIALLLPFVIPGNLVAEIPLGPLVLSVSREGLSRALLIVLRMTVGLFAVTVLTSTTGLGKIMRGMRQLHIPYVFVATLEFTVRYIFVLLDELKRMTLARKSRGFKKGNNLLHRQTFAVLGNQVGVLFLRAADRGDRIYRAMLARGYCGEASIRTAAAVKPLEIGWALCMLAAAIFFQTLPGGGMQWLM